MLPDFSANEWIVLVSAFIAGHTVLLMLSTRLSAIALLSMAFLIVAPLSVATELPGVAALKYVRLYLTLLGLLVAVFVFKGHRIRGPGRWLLVFAVAYMLCAVYGPHTLHGLLHKGMFVVVLLMGLTTAHAIYTHTQLRQVVRVLLFSSVVLMGVFLAGMAATPSNVLAFGRLSLFGINANGLALTSAVVLPMCVFVVFYDPAKPFKITAACTGFVAAASILYSGSRGGAVTALVGLFFMLLPLVKRPGPLIGVFALLGVGGLALSKVASGSGANRLQEINLDTRINDWTRNVEIIMESPMIGHGWVMIDQGGGPSPLNMLSIYLQVLAEMGLVGLMFLAVVIAVTLLHMLRLYRFTAATFYERGVLMLGVSYTMSVLANGVVESGPLFGSTVLPLFWGFGIGLLSVVPRLIDQRQLSVMQVYATPLGQQPMPLGQTA